MKTFNLNINNQVYSLEAEEEMPLLWALRDLLGLTGTKFGCGKGLCGACTVLLDENPARSCSVTVAACEGRKITTIESIPNGDFKGLMEEWVEHQVPQCGYCQTGQIMSAIGMLKANPKPSDQEIKTSMSGNICRCGTYPRILEAIKSYINHD